MIHETLVKGIVDSLPDSPIVLDLCAAPGGKTTSAINALPDSALVLANEVMPKRAAILRENLLKWGFPGVAVSNNQTKAFADRELFDLVIVDAPCSGEGMMRKEPEAAAQWSRGLVAQCAALQREILTDAVNALRPGGFLIYSTCTFNVHENEENLRFAAETFGLEPILTGLAWRGRIAPEATGSLPALRFMPHLTRGEGLFAAMLRKPGHSESRPARSDMRAFARLKSSLRLLLDGVPGPVMKGKTRFRVRKRHSPPHIRAGNIRNAMSTPTPPCAISATRR